MSKKKNRRIGRKNALRIKYPIDSETSYAKHDSIKACRRKYGAGQGK